MLGNHDMKKLVTSLVHEHFELENDLEQIIWLKEGPADETRLLEDISLMLRKFEQLFG